MPLASILPRSPRFFLLLGGVSLVLGAACSRPIYPVDSVITTHSCVNGARGIRFLMVVGPSSIIWEGGSANVLGEPSITDGGSGYLEVSAELDNVSFGDEVTLRFSLIGPFPFAGDVSDIGFFTVPPPGLPETPDCTPGDMADFALLNDIHVGLMLQVGNPSPQPMTLVSLELAEAPAVLPNAMLDWSNPAFAALPWQAALPGGTPLDSQAPPLMIDLPDQVAPATQATLMRFISLVGGVESRGIVQVDVNGAVAAQPTSWSALKSRYRN